MSLERQYRGAELIAEAMARAAREAYSPTYGDPSVVMPFAVAILAEGVAGVSRSNMLGLLLAVVEKLEGEMS